MSLTSIIILTLNNLEKTKKCLVSIRKYTHQPYELIIVDNGSTDGTIQYLKKFPDIKLICNKQNKGFAGGCNQGMKLAKGEQLLLLNNDTIVSHHWLDNLLKALYISPRIGMVGPLTNSTNPPGVKKPANVNYSNEVQYHQLASRFNQHDPSKWKAMQVLYGFCLLLKREVFDKIGLMDERFTIGTAEDNDFCLRATRAGYTLLLAGDTLVHHDGHASFKRNQINLRRIQSENIQKFVQKWGIQPSALVRSQLDFIPDGLLVKGIGPAIYYIDRQLRRPIKDQETLNYLKFKQSDAISVPNPKIQRYHVGEKIDKEVFSKKILNNFLVKSNDRDEIFLIQDDCKRLIKDKISLNYYGFLPQKIITLPNQIIESIQSGKNLESKIEFETQLPNLKVFKCFNTFYLSMNNSFYPIKKVSLEKLKLAPNKAIKISPQILYKFPIGKEIVYSWR
ncbi:glycosyltransferase family 2 protein [Metabacillus sediminilitoris]|nr:glycosyltransferase family 2 protein [Metabacillus sediminilitoris]